MRVTWLIMRPLCDSDRDGQLVFLTEEERSGLALVNPFSTEPSHRSLLDRLFSSDISTVYRLGSANTTPAQLFN